MSFKTVRGRRMRATVTDECGVPATGATDSVVTSGFVTVSLSPELEDRDEILLKNAAGEPCISDTIKPFLKWYNVEANFCEVNPALFAMMTGQETVDNWEATTVGFDISEEVADTGFALEVWTKIAGDPCAAGFESHGYFLLPWIDEGVFGDFTIENDAITFTVSGRTRANHAWGSGPYDVEATDANNTAGPLLVPVPVLSHLRVMSTTIAPPEPPA